MSDPVDDFFDTLCEGQAMFNGPALEEVTSPAASQRQRCSETSHRGLPWERQCLREGVVTDEGRLLCKDHFRRRRISRKLALFPELVAAIRLAMNTAGVVLTMDVGCTCEEVLAKAEALENGK